MSSLKSNRRLFYATIASFFASYLHLQVYRYLPFDGWMTNFWFTLRGPIQAPSEVVIVSIDDQSYAKLNVSKREVWPRELQAKLLQKLAKGGAKVVAFDMDFQGESREPQEDQALADALKLLPTVIPRDTLRRDSIDGTESRSQEIQALDIFRRGASFEARIALPNESRLVSRYGSLRPSPLLPSQNIAAVAVKTSGFDIEIPHPEDLINYYGPSGSIRTIPFYVALDSKTLPETFQGKIVFVGSQISLGNSINLIDTFQTPYRASSMFGVEIFATQAANLIQHNFIRRMRPYDEAFLMGIGLMLLAISSLAGSARRALLISIGTSSIWLALSYMYFTKGIFVPGASAVLLVLLVFLPLNWGINFAVTKHLFKHFVPGSTVDQLVSNPEMVSHHRTHTALAMMFTDVSGYTSLTEKSGEKNEGWMFDSYDSIFQKVLENFKGTEISSGGDEKFVGWGKEFGSKAPCDQVLACALELRRQLIKAANDGLIPKVTTRIGLHYGDSLLGFFGSGKALRYTAKGDSVNVAARLEGINQELGTTLLVSGEVLERVKDPSAAFFLGDFVPEGRHEAVSVSAVLDEQNIQPKLIQLKWNEAIHHFSARDWETALREFKKLETIPALQKAARCYLEACVLYKQSLLPAGWHGELWVTKKGAAQAPAL